MAQIFCSTRRLVEDFALDVQQKFCTRRLVAEKKLPTRRLLEGENGPNLLLYQTSTRGFCTRCLVEIFHQTSSSRKIATYQTSFRRTRYLLDVQQQKNSSTRHLVEFLLDAQQSFYQTSSRPDDLGHYFRSKIFDLKL